MTGPVEIVAAKTPDDYGDFTELLREYLASLPFSADFQHTERELAEISVQYGQPGNGVALLARSGQATVGITGIRALEGTLCELKRMYVKPSWRGLGLGRLLCEAALACSRQLGYSAVRLDTLDSMDAAIYLYRSLGFVDIPAYRHNPIEGAVFLEVVFPVLPESEQGYQ